MWRVRSGAREESRRTQLQTWPSRGQSLRFDMESGRNPRRYGQARLRGQGPEDTGCTDHATAAIGLAVAVPVARNCIVRLGGRYSVETILPPRRIGLRPRECVCRTRGKGGEGEQHREQERKPTTRIEAPQTGNTWCEAMQRSCSFLLSAQYSRFLDLKYVLNQSGQSHQALPR